MARASLSHLKISTYQFTWAIAAFARQQATELNPIAKNRDTLPTNGDSLQRFLVASEHQMLYNSCEIEIDLQPCFAPYFESVGTANFSEDIKNNCSPALNNFRKSPLAP
jgi:hypothetical protein